MFYSILNTPLEFVIEKYYQIFGDVMKNLFEYWKSDYASPQVQNIYLA